MASPKFWLWLLVTMFFLSAVVNGCNGTHPVIWGSYKDY